MEQEGVSSIPVLFRMFILASGIRRQGKTENLPIFDWSMSAQSDRKKLTVAVLPGAKFLRVVLDYNKDPPFVVPENFC